MRLPYRGERRRSLEDIACVKMIDVKRITRPVGICWSKREPQHGKISTWMARCRCNRCYHWFTGERQSERLATQSDQTVITDAQYTGSERSALPKHCLARDICCCNREGGLDCRFVIAPVVRNDICSTHYPSEAELAGSRQLLAGVLQICFYFVPDHRWYQ